MLFLNAKKITNVSSENVVYNELNVIEESCWEFLYLSYLCKLIARTNVMNTLLTIKLTDTPLRG